VLSVTFGGKSCSDCLGDWTKGLSDNLLRARHDTTSNYTGSRCTQGLVTLFVKLCATAAVLPWRRRGSLRQGGLGCQVLVSVQGRRCKAGVCRAMVLASHRHEYCCSSM
jgi:hypothetical protein